MEYVEHFQALVGIVETYGGAYGNKPGLIKAQLLEQGVLAVNVDMTNADKMKNALGVCREFYSYLLLVILKVSDNSRYYQLKTDLANNITKGQDNFPKTNFETTRLLNNQKVQARLQLTRDPDNNGVAFVQHTGDPAPPSTGDVLCWHCGKKGHYRSNCPKLQVQELEVGIQNLNIDNCKEEIGLFSSNKGLIMVQEGKKEKKGV
jgi:hypothetical protein